MAKKVGGLSEDFLDRNLPGRKKVDPKLKAQLETDPDDTPSEAAPEKPAETPPAAPAAAAPEKPAETPPAAPAAAPAAAPPEKPAAPAAAPAETPAAKPEPTIPAHIYADTRDELKQTKAQLAKLQQDLEDLKKPKVEVKKEPEDPEPDAKTHPIEHDQWEVRDLRRKIAATAAKVEELTSGNAQRTEVEQREYARVQFSTGIDKLINSHRSSANPAVWEPIPDIDDRISFLHDQLVAEYIDSGYTEEQAKALTENAKMSFYADCVGRKVNPIVAISKFATRRGYQAKSAAPAAAPAAQTPSGQIKSAQERESAARSASSFPGAPPAAAKDDDMSAAKWAKMSTKEKRDYKKAHGDPVPKFMGAEEAVV